MVQQAGTALPLTMVTPGQRVHVITIAAGQQATHRLTELGIVRGVTLRIVQDNGGALLIAVGDTRLALGRGIAHKICVRPAQEELP